MNVFFVSGTDTGIGKTVATALFARSLAEKGAKPITQKLVQTGCVGFSEDIVEHRRIIGCGLLDVDRDFTTCPYVLKYPASPHLVCKMENVKLDFAKIDACTKKLSAKFSHVIIEGAGGLMVPLEENFLTIDFVQQRNYPLVLVVPSNLGSLNHALLNFEICKVRGVEIAGVIYNTFAHAPAEIENSTREYIKNYLSANFPKAFFMEIADQHFASNE